MHILHHLLKVKFGGFVKIIIVGKQLYLQEQKKILDVQYVIKIKLKNLIILLFLKKVLV